MAGQSVNRHFHGTMAALTRRTRNSPAADDAIRRSAYSDYSHALRRHPYDASKSERTFPTAETLVKRAARIHDADIREADIDLVVEGIEYVCEHHSHHVAANDTFGRALIALVNAGRGEKVQEICDGLIDNDPFTAAKNESFFHALAQLADKDLTNEAQHGIRKLIAYDIDDVVKNRGLGYLLERLAHNGAVKDAVDILATLTKIKPAATANNPSISHAIKVMKHEGAGADLVSIETELARQPQSPYRGLAIEPPAAN